MINRIAQMVFISLSIMNSAYKEIYLSLGGKAIIVGVRMLTYFILTYRSF